jgi:BRCA1-associated protein
MPSYFFHLLFELYDTKSPYCQSFAEFSQQQLSPPPLWIPPVGTNIFTSLPIHPKRSVSDTPQQRPKQVRKNSKCKEKEFDRHPDWRFGPVSVESIDMAPATKSLGVIPSAGGAAPKARFVPLETTNTEFGYGVVHLYRDAHETPGLYYPSPQAKQKDTVTATPTEMEDLNDDALKTVAILAVPSYMSPADFMGFVGEGTRDTVSHLRMVRTGKANRYMVLMRFRDKDGAKQFVTDFNGKVFNSMEVRVPCVQAVLSRALVRR